VKSIHPQKPVTTKPAMKSTLAHAEKKPSLYLPAKATRDQYVSAQPAMLVVWQETYSGDGSVMIQQSFYRVVVLKSVTPQEQPAKTT
jgi:hypothetical protein